MKKNLTFVAFIIVIICFNTADAASGNSIDSLISALEDEEHYFSASFASSPNDKVIATFPEVQELIAIGDPAAEIIVNKFKEPYDLEKDIALASYAYILGELEYEPAVPILIEFLKNNDYEKMYWASHFSTHAIKKITHQRDTNIYYTYYPDEIAETIRRAEQFSSGALPGLTFESRSKSSGSDILIPLTLSGIEDNIGNMDMTLEYDFSVLKATSVKKGSLTTDSIFDYNILEDGIIKVSLADSDGFTGDGSVAHIQFTVIGTEGSSSPLHIEDISANIAEDYMALVIPANDGVFRVISVENSIGDGNGDGWYTALDALYALQMAVGKIPEDMTMDINGDGSVTSIDARNILLIAVGNE